MNNELRREANPEKTLDLLWTRIRQRGNLPAFSKVVHAILGAMRGENDREFNMTKTVLSDPSLTQKVLRLANSAMYAVFGRDINTVSKAVIVLGTEAIGHLALGSKLIDGLTAASTDSAGARDEMEKAVLAGQIARHITAGLATRDAEEVAVCSMLHSLGRMMVIFYLPESWIAVQASSAEDGIDESQAAREILGLGLDDIGKAIAQQWSLPAALVNSMKEFAPNAVGEPLDHADWLAAMSTMSSRCAAVVHEAAEAGAERVAGIATDYAELLGIEVPQIMAAVDTARLTVKEEDAGSPRTERRTDNFQRQAAVSTIGKPADAALILTRGVADMRDVAHRVSTGQLMMMALETVYKGLGLARAIVFLRSQEQGRYVARMCFGEGMQELMPDLQFDDAYQPDVFHAALANDKMILVDNALAPTFINKLPRWWKEILPAARSFLVLPLTVNRQPAGFIYGDWDKSVPIVKIENSEIPPLNEVRSLVVRAVEQRRRMEAGEP